jgi:type II secretory pathway pseudopilin PulG
LHREAGYTLVELLVATALGMVALAVVCAAVLYGSRAFVAMTNYLDLDEQSEQALDKMSREIRQADHLTAFASNDVSFADISGNTIRYLYQTNTYLTGCDMLTFSIYQRSTISNTFEPVSTSSYTNAKLVAINWNCSRDIQASRANSESAQSAKILIRNN